MLLRLILSCLLLACTCGTSAQGKDDDFAHFDVYADGTTIHLLTGHGKKGSAPIALFHRVSKDGGTTWSRPVRVNPPDRERVTGHHPGENPQVAASGDRVIVAWTEPRAGARRGGLIATMLSDDGGATWKAGATPFDNPAGSQTFMRMIAAGGTLHMAWLDSRERAQSLRYARSIDTGATWSRDVQIAPRTCECCWNSIAARGDETVVLFRGDAPRDMMASASRDGRTWSTPVSVDGSGWRINACPHVGGALVTAGGTLHALSWTGKDELQGLRYVAHREGKWSAPLRLGTDDARHADLASGPDGALIAVWDGEGGRGSPLRRATSRDGGATWGPPESIVAARDAHHPRVVATAAGTAVFWMEGQPWTAARLLVNGRALPSPAR
jgi:hypothetical protein